jgi:predicted CXXCH cytochrome family protein
VTIGSLSSEFEAVAFPHRKVYEIMLRGVNGNALSDAFHAQSMCMACHHHTPGENIANPPKCSTCHDRSISPVKAAKAPYLKTAYHQLCLGCHAAMDVKPAALDCAGCHAPVKNAADAKAKREVR